MSEDDSPIFGKVEIKPEGGINLKIIELSDIKKGENVLIFKKSDDGFYAVKGVFEVILNEDELRLKETKEEMGDPKIRRALAHALVEMNKDYIMQQSLVVAEEALTRKSTGKLKNFFKKKKEGHKLEMKTKRGCVYLMCGDEEAIL